MPLPANPPAFAPSPAVVPSPASLYASWMRSLRARNLSESTVRTYATGAQQLLEWLAQDALEVQTPEQVRRPDLESFLLEVMTHTSASTAKTRHQAISRYFAFLLQEEEITRSPMEKVRVPAVPEVPVLFLSDDDLRRLLATCDGQTCADRPDTAILRLVTDTGMRRSELANLLVEQVDLDEHVAIVFGKGRRSRACPFGHKTAAALDRYLRRRAKLGHASDRRHLLGDLNKCPLSHDGVEQMVRRRVGQADLAGEHAHVFRHTADHTWLAQGGQEQDLMRLLGWRSRAMVGR